MNAWETFIHTHLPVDGVRKWLEDRDEKRAEEAEFAAAFTPEAVAKRALEQDDPAIKAMYDVGKPVTLATPMTQIPAGVSIVHNDHLIESSERTTEQAAAASWHKDAGESWMGDKAEFERQEAHNEQLVQQQMNQPRHPIDHLRGNGYGTPEVTVASEIQSDKGQPDLFNKTVLSYPPESRGPSGYKPTESAQYQAEQTFYGKYSPTMSQQQRDAGRVATAERQSAQSGLFGTMERQQEKEL